MEGENAGAKQELAAIAFIGPAAELIEKRFRDDIEPGGIHLSRTLERAPTIAELSAQLDKAEGYR